MQGRQRLRMAVKSVVSDGSAMITTIKARAQVHEAAARSTAAVDRSGMPAFLKASLAASPDAAAARLLKSIREMIPRN